MLPPARKTIFCPLHGYTHWEPTLLEVVNTPEFQRLKSIKQLAAVHHVFPGATHTRFEHSLGVGHLAERFAKRLLEHHPGLPIEPFTLKLAGLCHDLGHGPLSHAYDAFLAKTRPDAPMHETRSVSLLRRIVADYDIAIDARVVDDACELIAPVRRDLPLYLYQIIANEVDGIDVDKLDYLCRDSKNTGMPYSIDVERFFEYARVVDGRLCYSLKMAHTIHHTVEVRHQLHAQVYQHRVVRAIELMHIKILCLLGEVAYAADELTDQTFTRGFAQLQLALGRIGVRAYAEIVATIRAIETRDLYPCVLERNLGSLDFADLAPLLGELVADERFIVDRITIGYAEHPLFRVSFYDEGGRRTGLVADATSATFSAAPCDRILRVYRKTAPRRA